MNKILPILLALAAFSAMPSAHAAVAAPVPAPSLPPPLVAEASGECRAIGRQIAARHGGTLADARVEKRGGRNVCVGVVVVPPRDGKRGQQIPFAEPM